MLEKTPTGRPQQPSEDDRIMVEFVRFISKRGFSADQIREAYYHLCGISEVGDSDPAIEEIRQEMQSMTDRKFPLNRFASLIGRKQEYEDAKPSCFNFINTLSISNKEKDVLRSIVEQRRSGELSMNIDGQRAVAAAIHIREDIPTEIFALEFMRLLQTITTHVQAGKKYTFSFIEE